MCGKKARCVLCSVSNRSSSPSAIVDGQWPYQSTKAKRGFLAVFIILIASAGVTLVPAVVKYRDDREMLMECFLRYIFAAISMMKLFSFMLHSQKRLKLLNLIRTNWQVWARDQEVVILHGYAKQGEKMAIMYTVMAYSSLFANMIQPLIPTIIDVLLKNGTASREFPYPIVCYNMNEQKYYFYLIMHANVCAGLLTTVIVSNDVILIIFVQHVSSIFSALGHKLKRIGNNATSVETGENPYTLDMAHLTSCIARHNHAIEYANLIEASYTRTIFLTVGLGMILINAVSLQMLMVSSDPIASIRYIASTLGLMSYFFIECYVSQLLIDHSISIRYYIYNSQWYRLPSKAQKLLQFMMMRSTIPCHLTAGKMMVLSVRSFWLVLKTTVSYFGFLRSTQGL